MKRLTLLAVLILLCVAVVPAFAQDNANLITLNDATPAIDAVITLPQDTTGTIALDFSGAAVRLLDATGAVVFSAADARLHGLQLNLAPNSGSHTLTVERLPGLTEASVRVMSLPEIVQNGATTLIAGLGVTLNQEVSLPINTDHPGDTVAVNIPADTMGVVTATFPGANATAQVIDANGGVLAQSNGGHVDGISLVLDSGDYQITVLGTNLTDPVTAGVRAVSTTDAGVSVVAAPAGSASNTTVSNTAACEGIVLASSANLRSGPGTGYSVLGYAYRDEVYPIGGQNPEASWVVVATATGSAWVSRTNMMTQGNCANLTVFNVPLRDAQPAPIIITSGGQVIQQSGSGSAPGGFSGESEHEDEHEEEHEGGDD